MTIVASLHNGDYKNLICEGASKMILLIKHKTQKQGPGGGLILFERAERRAARRYYSAKRPQFLYNEP